MWSEFLFGKKHRQGHSIFQVMFQALKVKGIDLCNVVYLCFLDAGCEFERRPISLVTSILFKICLGSPVVSSVCLQRLEEKTMSQWPVDCLKNSEGLVVWQQNKWRTFGKFSLKHTFTPDGTCGYHSYPWAQGSAHHFSCQKPDHDFLPMSASVLMLTETPEVKLQTFNNSNLTSSMDRSN